MGGGRIKVEMQERTMGVRNDNRSVGAGMQAPPPSPSPTRSSLGAPQGRLSNNEGEDKRNQGNVSLYN
jgi:hypothetical protein